RFRKARLLSMILGTRKKELHPLKGNRDIYIPEVSRFATVSSGWWQGPASKAFHNIPHVGTSQIPSLLPGSDPMHMDEMAAGCVENAESTSEGTATTCQKELIAQCV